MSKEESKKTTKKNTSKKKEKEIKEEIIVEKNDKKENKKKEEKSKDTKKTKIEPKVEEENTKEKEIIEVDEDSEEYDEDLEDNYEEDIEEIIEESDISEEKEETAEKVVNETAEDTKEDDSITVKDKETEPKNNKQSEKNTEKKKEDKITVKEKNKKEKNKSEKKEDNKKAKDNNIKNIEAKVKANKKKNKGNNKVSQIGYFLEEHIHIIFAFLAGVFISVLVALIIWPDRIATLKDGTQPIVKINGKNYTANALYDQMKDHYSVSQLLDLIDNDLLTKMYPEDDTMNEEVKSTAEYYINMYKQYYNYTEEEFLSANGFKNYNAYLDYLKLDNRRNKYLDEYVEKNLTDKEIQKYYDDNVYGDINCQHILVETSSDSSSDSSSDNKNNKLSDDDAKKLAQEIIDKLNDGTSWDDVKKEYKDKVTFEDLKYQSWDADLEDSFKNALKDMENESYSKEPVKTSYGYHVIYRKDQKKAPSLKKTKEKIVDKLVEQKKKDDENLLYKAMINLRNEKKIKFYDTDMEDKYKTYKKQYS